MTSKVKMHMTLKTHQCSIDDLQRTKEERKMLMEVSSNKPRTSVTPQITAQLL
jgi:hypothetical protein